MAINRKRIFIFIIYLLVPNLLFYFLKYLKFFDGLPLSSPMLYIPLLSYSALTIAIFFFHAKTQREHIWLSGAILTYLTSISLLLFEIIFRTDNIRHSWLQGVIYLLICYYIGMILATFFLPKKPNDSESGTSAEIFFGGISSYYKLGLVILYFIFYIDLIQDLNTIYSLILVGGICTIPAVVLLFFGITLLIDENASYLTYSHWGPSTGSAWGAKYYKYKNYSGEAKESLAAFRLLFGSLPITVLLITTIFITPYETFFIGGKNIKYVSRESNQDVLIEIVKGVHGFGLEERGTAAEKILHNISSKNNYTFNELALATAIITDQELLSGIAQSVKDSNIQSTALSKITDPKILLNIKTTYYLSANQIVSSINDKTILTQLAEKSPNSEIQNAAKSKLKKLK